MDAAGRASRLVSVDLLRGIAILLVLGVHWNLSDLAAPADSLLDNIVKSVAARGGEGVTLFFGVSGFLIMRTIMLRENDIYRMSWSDFYIRRIARIQPLLVAAIALGGAGLLVAARTPWAHWVFGSGSPHPPVFWLSLSTFSFNWLLSAHTVIERGSGMHWLLMWSLAVEEQFYLVLPWAVLLAGSMRRLTMALFVIVAVSMLTRLVSLIEFTDDFLQSWSSNTFWHAGSIAIGVLCALHYDELNPRRPKIIALAGAIAILVGYFYPDNINAPNLLAGGAGAFILGSAKGDLFPSAIWRIPAQLGKASYEIYLLHMPVFYLIGPYLKGLSALGGWFGLAVVSFGVGHLVRIGFTEPVNLRLRQQFLGRRVLVG